MSIWENLAGLKTSAEFEKGEAELRAEKRKREVRLAELEKSLEDAPFSEGAQGVDTIGADIAVERIEITKLDRAIAGAIRRREEAKQREHAADVAAKMAPAPELRDTIVDKIKERHLHLREAVRLTIELSEEQGRLDSLNLYGVAENRGDLCAYLPWPE